MLGDGSRGAILEMTLAKVLYISSKSITNRVLCLLSCYFTEFDANMFYPESTQIIGMSATLGNVADLLSFLKAENYTNDFRPVNISVKDSVRDAVCQVMPWCSDICAAVLQVQLKEYVKLRDSIYEVDPKEEQCFRFSRVLKFNVGGDSVCVSSVMKPDFLPVWSWLIMSS